MRGTIQRTVPRLEPRPVSSSSAMLIRGKSLEEIKFVEEQAQLDPRVRAIVAHAPLERGGAVEPLLEESVRCSSKLRGIRRILQAETDLGALLQNSRRIEGVRLLRKFDLHFEITVTHRQMDCVVEFVRSLPEIPMVLDHCGKPGIRHGLLDAFRHHVGELSRLPNIHCKLSGLATEAEHGSWTEAQLFPYIDTALQAFGPDRLLYGSDWPVCLLATSLPRWISVLERALVGCSQQELRKIFRDNANALYRLGLPEDSPVLMPTDCRLGPFVIVTWLHPRRPISPWRFQPRFARPRAD